MKVFRPASTTSAVSNLTKTGLQTAVFWAIFLFAVPSIIVYYEGLLGIVGFERQVISGALLFIIAGLLGLWSGYTMSTRGVGTPLPMDCPQKLVVAGPYGYVRNPMAVAGISQGIAVGLMMGSFVVIAYALLGAVLWHIADRPAEEADLKDRFGVDFDLYCSATRCWWPTFNNQ